MPSPRSQKHAEIVIHRPRYWACAIAPWIILLCVCSVCSPPHSPFRVGISRLWRFVSVDSPSWIYNLLKLWISRRYHSLSDQWGTMFSASLIQSITVMRALWWRIFLGLAVFLVIWSLWRSFKQQIHGAMLFLNAVLIAGILIIFVCFTYIRHYLT